MNKKYNNLRPLVANAVVLLFNHWLLIIVELLVKLMFFILHSKYRLALQSNLCKKIHIGRLITRSLDHFLSFICNSCQEPRKAFPGLITSVSYTSTSSNSFCSNYEEKQIVTFYKCLKSGVKVHCLTPA